MPYTRKRRLAKRRRKAEKIERRKTDRVKHLERSGLQVITDIDMAELKRIYAKA